MADKTNITIELTAEQAQQVMIACTFRLNHDGNLMGPNHALITDARAKFAQAIAKHRTDMILAAKTAQENMCPNCGGE